MMLVWNSVSRANSIFVLSQVVESIAQICAPKKAKGVCINLLKKRNTIIDDYFRR